jgi:alanyl-tRNA synthetase
VDEAGRVHHLVDGDLPAVGTAVIGAVDRARRRDFMAQHTGQHLLSQAILRVAEARTVSARLGETVCTLDLAAPEPSDAAIRRAEALVNAIIDEDLPVRTWFPSPEELAALPLRRPPQVTTNVRLVGVGDFELTACGGTHCRRSGEVGLLLVLGSERYKGGARLTFVAGPRARAVAAAQVPVLAEVGRSLSAAPLEVPRALATLRDENQALTLALRETRGRLGEATALALLSTQAGPEVVGVLPGVDVETLRQVGKRVVAEPGRVALLAAPGAATIPVLVTRGTGSPFDCGAFLRVAAAAAGGKGGGRPDHAEGRLPAGVDWPALVAAHRGAGQNGRT